MKYLEDFAANGKEIEGRDLFTLYSVDATATTGFGIDAKGFEDPNSVFKDQASNIVGPSQK